MVLNHSCHGGTRFHRPLGFTVRIERACFYGDMEGLPNSDLGEIRKDYFQQVMVDCILNGE